MTTGRQMKVDFEILVNVEIIVGIPLLIKAIILGIQNILEVLLEDIETLKWNRYFYTIILRLFLIPF